MKYIKHFENTKNKLNLGDYVICEEIASSGYEKQLFKDVIEFEKNRIGKYVKYDNNNGDFKYTIYYDDIPQKFKDKYFMKEYDIDKYCRPMSRKEIIYNSKNKEDLEAIINANKFNI
jgi:hypothetical protein